MLPHLSQAASCRTLGPGSGPCPALPLPALRHPAAWGSRPSRPPAVEALLLPGPGAPRRRPACRQPAAPPEPYTPRQPPGAPERPPAARRRRLRLLTAGIERGGLEAGGTGRRAVSPRGAVPFFFRRKDWQLCPSATGGASHSAPHGQTAPPVTPKMEATANFRVQEVYQNLFVLASRNDQSAPPRLLAPHGIGG